MTKLQAGRATRILQDLAIIKGLIENQSGYDVILTSINITPQQNLSIERVLPFEKWTRIKREIWQALKETLPQYEQEFDEL